jgi:TfoX/Sxy family transcriptional regulator of competence genes
MFVYACAFVNGNMFAGLHEENICVRIGKEAATDRIETGKAQTFAPMAGRAMKEYVALPKADCVEIERLKSWIAEAFRHSLNLPPKIKKPKKARQPAAAKKTRTSAPGWHHGCRIRAARLHAPLGRSGADTTRQSHALPRVLCDKRPIFMI